VRATSLSGGTQAFLPVRPAEFHSAVGELHARVNCAGSGLQTRWSHRPQACVPAIAFRMDLHREEDPSPLRDCDFVNVALFEFGEKFT
jgi:hypothetical protein